MQLQSTLTASVSKTWDLFTFLLMCLLRFCKIDTVFNYNYQEDFEWNGVCFLDYLIAQRLYVVEGSHNTRTGRFRVRVKRKIRFSVGERARFPVTQLILQVFPWRPYLCPVGSWISVD